jgi:hypothetical protein
MKAKTNKIVFNPNHRGESGKKKIGDNQPPKNKVAFNKDIKIICPYSAKKNRANVIAEYSTLNPETNSDSPSAKSKGALFVSAREEMKNMANAGKRGIKNHTSF